jgi:hypothetical protein
LHSRHKRPLIASSSTLARVGVRSQSFAEALSCSWQRLVGRLIELKVVFANKVSPYLASEGFEGYKRFDLTPKIAVVGGSSKWHIAP